MARSYARIYTSIWDDPDFRALGSAQHMYFLLLAQPKLSLAGCIDMKPRSWAAMSGLTTGQVVSLLDELEQARFVVIDPDTDELVIRTFTQHDQATANGNLIKGMWSAWSAIESPPLRRVVLQHMPRKCFEPKYEPRSEPPSEPGFRPGIEPPQPQPHPQPALVPGSNPGSAAAPVDNRPADFEHLDDGTVRPLRARN